MDLEDPLTQLKTPKGGLHRATDSECVSIDHPERVGVLAGASANVDYNG